MERLDCDGGILDSLIERSNLLGADRSVANWGGGNTSAKTEGVDFRGRVAPVLWVKGSGFDLATIDRSGFSGLLLLDIDPLAEREHMSDAEMIAYLQHCYVAPSQARPSIETLMHAFLPFPHIDHTHPDAINFLACSRDGERIAKEIFGEKVIWIPYSRPGFALARQIALAVRSQPRATLIILAKHGLITWGQTTEACAASCAAAISHARAAVEKRQPAQAFGGPRCPILPKKQRHDLLATILPGLRGLVSMHKRMVLRVDDTDDVLEFASSINATGLTMIGAACPDHLIHTKPLPLLVDWTPEHGTVETLREAIADGVTLYKERYQHYLDDNVTENLDPYAVDPIYRPAAMVVDTAPRVVLIPGVGMVTTGKDATAADISAQLYHRAISVMRGAEACGGFVSLTPAESYAVEFWPLETYKLNLAPPERELAGQVALVTGGAGGIGAAICRRLARDGAHVVVADIDSPGAHEVADEIQAAYGQQRAISVAMDVTEEASVAAAFAEAIRRYGGLDIIVSNAGVASSSSIVETSLAEWRRNHDILTTGYFLVSRAAFRLWTAQGIGGSLVFVASKNAVVAGKNVAAYSSAKAAEIHLARCLAEEGGSHGIRVNTVNPDAVLSGSRIFSSEWRKQRALGYGVAPEELESYYRKRTTLGVSILPDDIAEAVAFFATGRSIKTTGNMLNVDGGVAAAYPR